MSPLIMNGQMSKASSAALGEFQAFAQVCYDVGAYDASMSERYQRIVEDHLDISAYHQTEFSDAQYRVYETYFQSDRAVIYQQCEEIKPDAEKAHALLDQRLKAIKVEGVYSLLDSIINLAGLTP